MVLLLHLVEPHGDGFGSLCRYIHLLAFLYTINFDFRSSYVLDYNAAEKSLLFETRVQHIEICNIDMIGMFVFNKKKELYLKYISWFHLKQLMNPSVPFYDFYCFSYTITCSLVNQTIYYLNNIFY